LLLPPDTSQRQGDLGPKSFVLHIWVWTNSNDFFLSQFIKGKVTLFVFLMICPTVFSLGSVLELWIGPVEHEVGQKKGHGVHVQLVYWICWYCVLWKGVNIFWNSFWLSFSFCFEKQHGLTLKRLLLWYNILDSVVACQDNCG
jgi:hypothetical protein